MHALRIQFLRSRPGERATRTHWCLTLIATISPHGRPPDTGQYFVPSQKTGRSHCACRRPEHPARFLASLPMSARIERVEEEITEPPGSYDPPLPVGGAEGAGKVDGGLQTVGVEGAARSPIPPILARINSLQKLLMLRSYFGRGHPALKLIRDRGRGLHGKKAAWATSVPQGISLLRNGPLLHVHTTVCRSGGPG